MPPLDTCRVSSLSTGPATGSDTRTILADYREEKSELVKSLRALGVKVSIARLDVSDYVITDSIAIECKRSRDFVASLMDGRLSDQTSRLRRSYHIPVILLIGTISDCVSMAPNEGLVLSSIADLIANGVTFISVESPMQAAQVMKWLARAPASYRSVLGGPLIKRAKKAESDEEKAMILLSSVPGIGPKLAARLLKSFPNVGSIFEASEAKLSAVIGTARARKMRSLLDRAPVNEKYIKLSSYSSEKD